MTKAQEIEKYILLCEGELERLYLETVIKKAELKALQQQRASLVKVKWVKEISKCFTDLKNTPIPLTAATIIKIIEKRTGIVADTSVKNKVSTVLSRMVNAGEVLKAEYAKTIYYGSPELFEKDGVTLNKRAKHLIITADDEDD